MRWGVVLEFAAAFLVAVAWVWMTADYRFLAGYDPIVPGVVRAVGCAVAWLLGMGAFRVVRAGYRMLGQH